MIQDMYDVWNAEEQSQTNILTAPAAAKNADAMLKTVNTRKTRCT
jgi:hypothetical protein